MEQRKMRSFLLIVALLIISLAGAWRLPYHPRPPLSSVGRSICRSPSTQSPSVYALQSLQQRSSLPTKLWAADPASGEQGESKLPFLLDPNTRGGVLFLSTIGTVAVFAAYQLAVFLGVDGLQAGLYTSVAVTIGIIFWTLSYVFRVANKDMTYARQLKNYEDAVLQKRLEELEEDEVQALLEEVESEASKRRS